MADKYQYELTYVISGVVKQNQVDDIVNSINNFVQGNGGEIIEVDEWGNQRLAYEIDKKRSGYYVNMFFRAPGSIVPKVERQLQINDDVLRYLTLRMDAKMKRHYKKRKRREAAAEEAAAEEAAAEEAAAEEADGDQASDDSDA